MGGNKPFVKQELKLKRKNISIAYCWFYTKPFSLKKVYLHVQANQTKKNYNFFDSFKFLILRNHLQSSKKF